MCKEQIYDNQISPLMAQIIAICKEHKIAHVCTFALDDIEDGLRCTSANLEENFNPPDDYKQCVDLLYRKKEPWVLAMAVTTSREAADKKKENR